MSMLKLYQAALAAGVAINPGPEWSTDKAHSGSRLRLCFAPRTTRSAKASPCWLTSAARNSACRRAEPMWRSKVGHDGPKIKMVRFTVIR